MKEIAERIKETRMRRGMTQQELAEAIGLKNRSSINKIEKGYYEPSLPAIIKIAKALNVDPDYLVFGDEESKKAEIEELFSHLTEAQQDAALAFLRSLTAERE